MSNKGESKRSRKRARNRTAKQERAQTVTSAVERDTKAHNHRQTHGPLFSDAPTPRPAKRQPTKPVSAPRSSRDRDDDNDLSTRDMRNLMMPGNYLPRRHRDRSMPRRQERLTAESGRSTVRWSSAS